MSGENNQGGGAWASVPEGVPGVQATERANAVADAILKARSKRASGEGSKEQLIQEALEKSETAEMRKALGLDIPFDVKTLLTRGVVEKRGIKIADDFFIDMHTLSKAEDVLAERLVEQFYGPMQLTKSYLEAKMTATLAIAITRINKDRFPVPDLDPAKRHTEEWKNDWDLKMGLMKALNGMPSGDVDTLGVVYSNLDKADVLIEEEARPKSSRP